jgi:hypothetical protein
MSESIALSVDPERAVLVATSSLGRQAEATISRAVVEGYRPLWPAALDLLARLGVQQVDPHAVAEELAKAESALRPAEAGQPVGLQEAIKVSFPGRRASQLVAEQPAEIDWLVPGLLAPGWLVKIAAREKTGKGTFVYYLLGQLERGEPTLFGPGQAGPVSAVILTEEPSESIREKVEAFGLERAQIIFGYEFGGLSWAEKVERLTDAAVIGGHQLVFVDNISRATGVEDENGVELGKAAALLGDAVARNGLAGLIDHHHKKGTGSIEDKSRGGTALPAACDVNVEMFRDGSWTSRRRKLSARGRVSATIWQREIELSEDGDSYREIKSAGGDVQQLDKDAEREAHWRLVLKQAGRPLTRDELAAKLSVSGTTVKRYEQAMSERGVVQLAYGAGGARTIALVEEAGQPAIDQGVDQD